MDTNSEIIRALLAELIDELGGVAQLDAHKVLENARNNRFKRIGLRMEKDIIILEVFDEDED